MKNISKKLIASFFILQILFPGSAKVFAESMVTEKLPYIEGEVLVQYSEAFMNAKNPQDLMYLQDLIENHDQNVKEVIADDNMVVISENQNTVEKIFATISGIGESDTTKKLMNEYSNNPFVMHVQPNFLYTIQDNEMITEKISDLDQNVQEKILQTTADSGVLLGSNLVVDTTDSGTILTTAMPEKSETILSNSGNIPELT